MNSWPREAVPHPLAALGDAEDTFRVNPLFSEDEETADLKTVICCQAKEDNVSVSSGNHSDTNKQPVVTKARPTSISSGYGSSAAEDSPILMPTLQKISLADTVIPRPIWPMDAMDFTRRTLMEVAQIANSAVERPLGNARNRSSQNYEQQMEDIRIRLRAALDQLARPVDLDSIGGRCYTYSGVEVKPGDVHMKAKHTDLTIYSTMGRFTLDAARSEVLAKKLSSARKRRRVWRTAAALGAVVLLIGAVAAAELALSSGKRLFGVFL